MKLVQLIQIPVLLIAMIAACGVAAMHHRQAQVTVVLVTMDYGNIDVDADAATIESLGLEKGATFSIGFEGKEFKVYFGDTYSDVPRGDWVAFMLEEGGMRIARNYEDAATTLGVEAGDTITLYN